MSKLLPIVRLFCKFFYIFYYQYCSKAIGNYARIVRHLNIVTRRANIALT